MDDNATCHRTLAVQDCLDSEGIQRLVWPARSPDLNPIENVWDALGRQVVGRNYPPTNKNTLILFFDKAENARQVAKIVNGVYGADTVTANYVQFWYRRFRSGISDVKDAPRKDRPVVKNVDTISEIIEVDRHENSTSDQLDSLVQKKSEVFTSIVSSKLLNLKEKLNLLLETFQNVLEPGREATNILENHINAGNSPPISVPPYRMSPVKNCSDCIKYKASNQKLSGLLQTPVLAQRFETLAIDLFGTLPESKDGKRLILIIEDCTTKWVELFALPNATAKECAITLIEEDLLRYGIPRRLISDNGTQFVSAVIQQICYLLNIHQSLILVYHPQANPVERKNRDLKPRLGILVQDKHDCWSEKLPYIRFALNTAKCETTGHTAAFLNFGRELRTPSEVVKDIRVVIQNDNFVPEITPYLKKFAKFSTLRLERWLKSNRIVGSFT
ncbi:retrovirus-related Pol polyprotein from transposon 412 [Trichonephila clavipes]|nr:retrovirus-related Pol polyprotein from transposon 412 [Trichonephila clavipes]